MDHWKVVKKVLHYLLGTKRYMLMYKKFDSLEVLLVMQTLISLVVLTVHCRPQHMSSH